MKKESTDSKSPTKSYTKYGEIVLLVLSLLAIGMISIKGGFLENLKPNTPTEKAIMFGGIFIMIFLVLAVHELGHLLVGLTNGFRFELYVVGPLGIRRDKDQVKVYLNKNIAYYGGIAGTTPREDHPDNAKKFAQILLAGPLASLLFAVLCFALAYLTPTPFGIIFYTGGLTSIAVFFATTIPSRTGMFFTDRKRYQRLVRPGKDQQVELAVLRIMGKFSKDNSYKNMDEQDIHTLVSEDLPAMKFFGLFNLICFQLENRGAVDEETQRAYEDHSKNMSKALVQGFDKEIAKFKERLNIEA